MTIWEHQLPVGEIRDMLNLLFDEFNIKPVSVTIKNVKRTYGGEDIQIGLKPSSSLKNMEDLVLHEFTHTLDWRKNGNQYRKKNGMNTYHDGIFTKLLEQVTIAWYGNIESYSWGDEYPAVIKSLRREL